MTQTVNRDEFDKALESVRNRITLINDSVIKNDADIKSVTRRVEKMEGEHENICKQLINTERDMRREFRDGIDSLRIEQLKSHKEVMTAIGMLLNDKAARDGREQAEKELRKDYKEDKKTALSILPKLLYWAFAAGMATIAYLSGKGGNP